MTHRSDIWHSSSNSSRRTKFEADGKTVRYGRDGLTPMTLEEWVDAQVSDAPHLFESNAGSGAAGNGSGGGGGRPQGLQKNPLRCYGSVRAVWRELASVENLVPIFSPCRG